MSNPEEKIAFNLETDSEKSRGWPKFIQPDPVQMPEIVFTAGPIPPGYSVLSIEFNLQISYKENGRQDMSQIIQGQMQNGGKVTWPADFIRGGQLSGLGRVQARTPGGTVYWDDWRTLNLGAILGINPDFQRIKNQVPNHLQALAVAWQKTGVRMFGSQGEPVFDTSHEKGFGMFQLTDIPVSEADRIWNWVKNCDSGIAVFRGKESNAAQYIQDMRKTREGLPDLTPEQKLLETYQQYTGQHYFIPVRKTVFILFRRWEWEKDKAADTGFADGCLQLYKKIVQGSVPGT